METLNPLRTRRTGGPTRLAIVGLIACVSLGAALGCADQKAASAATARPSAAPPAAANGIPDVLASVGDEKVTIADLRSRIGDDLDQMESRYQQSRHKLIDGALQDILRERVLGAEAKRQGKTIDQLVAAEAGGSIEPTDVEVTAWYEQNKARLSGRPLETLRPQIADYLRKERQRDAAKKLNDRLDKERKVAVYLQPYRVSMNNDGAPALGPANSPVTLVEFSDFQCPYCKGFFPVLKQIEDKYKDKVKIIYRQYPIASLHQFAPKAAEASLCAHEQGKFWELHDLMFQEQDKLAIKDLKEKASRIGLDQKKFDSCLDSGKFAERVQDDMREGSRNGVTGTPALYINGVYVEGGAVGLDVMTRLLDEELERTKR
jgi:protein-disulfide isomerase